MPAIEDVLVPPAVQLAQAVLMLLPILQPSCQPFPGRPLVLFFQPVGL
jgi:hypothetical protein